MKNLRLKQIRLWAMWLLAIDLVLWVTSTVLGIIALRLEHTAALPMIMFIWGGLADLGTIALCFAFAGYWDEIKAWCARNLSG